MILSAISLSFVSPMMALIHSDIMRHFVGPLINYHNPTLFRFVHYDLFDAHKLFPVLFAPFD
jgi:hypothetical protein